MKPNYPKIALLALPAITWMALIFLLSHQPGGDSGLLSKQLLDFCAKIGIDLRTWFGEKNAFFLIRKAAHFTEYAILALLIHLPFKRLAPHPQNLLWTAGISILYAASDEFHQLFIPGRVGDIRDVLIDSTGALFAFLFLFLLAKWRGRVPGN